MLQDLGVILVVIAVFVGVVTLYQLAALVRAIVALAAARPRHDLGVKAVSSSVGCIGIWGYLLVDCATDPSWPDFGYLVLAELALNVGLLGVGLAHVARAVRGPRAGQA